MAGRSGEQYEPNGDARMNGLFSALIFGCGVLGAAMMFGGVMGWDDGLRKRLAVALMMGGFVVVAGAVILTL